MKKSVISVLKINSRYLQSPGLKLSGKNTRSIVENFENQLHVLLSPRRRQIALTNVVDFGVKLASAQKGMRSEHVTQSNGGVVQKSSIRKLSDDSKKLLLRDAPSLLVILLKDKIVCSWFIWFKIHIIRY